MSKKIVVTDGYALNPGDLSWEPISALGSLEVYDSTPAELVVERCPGASIILTNKVPVNREMIENLPDLELIQVTATGYNVVDIVAAKEKGITVCNVPSYGTSSVAQHTIALMLELANHVGLHSRSVAEGEWQRSKDWCYMKAPIMELDGKTIGIVGFGNIGQQVARIAGAFGMKVIYYARTRKDTNLGEYAPLRSLFPVSDFISLHCPLTSDNHQFINSELLGMMKQTAFLVNTARGHLINETDLAVALNNNKLAGAALDVLSVEPPPGSNPLLTARNCIITPHNAWMSREARQRMIGIIENNIKAFKENRPVNVV